MLLAPRRRLTRAFGDGYRRGFRHGFGSHPLDSIGELGDQGMMQGVTTAFDLDVSLDRYAEQSKVADQVEDLVPDEFV